METTQKVQDLAVGQYVLILDNGDVIGGGTILEISTTANKVTINQQQIIRYKGHTEEHMIRSGHYLHGYIAAAPC